MFHTFHNKTVYAVCEKQENKIQGNILFTKLDVIIESKNENDFISKDTCEEGHCFLSSRRCVILAEDVQYKIPTNTTNNERPWIDIKITQKDIEGKYD